MEQPTECQVCCNTLNKTTIKPVKCPFCDYISCRKCVERYILSESQPQCMNCKKPWSRKFLSEQMTGSFMTNEYKKYRENILFDQERALLPLAQLQVEARKHAKQVRQEIQALQHQISLLRHEITLKEMSIHPDALKKSEHKSYAFIRQCPADGCRGFLSTQWKCGICDKWTCPSCHEIKGVQRDAAHTCNSEHVKTVQMLAKDSKPCPKCASMIYKIHGCNHMFCTQCKTPFNWQTGAITENSSNPHYHEWMRQHRGDQNNGDQMDECGGIRRLNANHAGRITSLINTFSQKMFPYPNDKRTKNMYRHYHNPALKYSSDKLAEHNLNIDRLYKIIENCNHNAMVELPRYNTDYINQNQYLRIHYLEQLIDENQFKTVIQRQDKKTQKNVEFTNVLDTAGNVLYDIIGRFMNWMPECQTIEDLAKYLEQMFIEIDNLKTYCNELLKDVAKTYKCVSYSFTSEFKYLRTDAINGVVEKKKTLMDETREQMYRDELRIATRAQRAQNRDERRARNDELVVAEPLSPIRQAPRNTVRDTVRRLHDPVDLTGLEFQDMFE